MNCKVLNNLYYKTTSPYAFKDVTGMHCKKEEFGSGLNRTYLKIIDLVGMLKYGLKGNSVKTIQRISMNAQYKFDEHMSIFYY